MSKKDSRPKTAKVEVNAGALEAAGAAPSPLDKRTGFAGMWRNRSTTFRYAVYGALFGFAFPVFSTLLDLLVQRLPLTWQNLLYVQSRTPLHWVIDTAPFFLGLFASFAGRRQERLEQRSQERDLVLRQLESLQTGLEQRMADRARALALATDVGQRLLAVRDLDTLLGEAVELIRSSFDLYHVQVYLMDSSRRNLSLRAGTGQAGALLVRRGHTLPVGPGSINGTAAAEKHAVIVSHTAQSPTYRLNPLLPETRSEMAVPMMIGGQVVGVINLQDDKPGSLTNESLPIFETLASQFAVAVDNASLFADAAQARADLEVQLKRVASSGWQDFLDSIHRGERIGYTLAGDAVQPLTAPLITKAAPHVLEVPLQVQETSVGMIQIEGESGRAWTAAETELVASVARNVAQHVENLRLLAQADQYRTTAEQASRRLTREGWQDYLAAKAGMSAGFVYDQHEVKPLAPEGAQTVEAREPALTRPLQVRGEAIGELALGPTEGLDDEAVELVDTVAARLSTHLENLRLFEETRTREQELAERSQELEASQRVTFAAAETADPEVLLDLVVNLIRDQFDLYHVQVYLADEARNAAVLSKGTGYAGQQLLARGHQIPLDRPSLVTRAINAGQTVIVNNVTADESWLPNPLLPQTQSELVLPLRTSDSVIGALDVQSRTPNRFTPALVALFQAMAEQVAMTFQTANLLTRTMEQAEVLTRYAGQLETAAQVSERASAILDPEGLMNEVVELLQSRFGLYHAHIYLLDQPSHDMIERTDPEEMARLMQEHRLFMRAGSGEIGKVLRERDHSIPLDAEYSLVARAARSREISVVNDTSLDPNFMSNPLLPQTRSELSIPLMTGTRVLGILDVQDNRPDRFGQSDVSTFSTLAAQVATALQNAAFFEELQQAAERLRELDRLKSEFLANMSHELRTPLNSIVGYIQLLLMDLEGEIPEESYEDMKSVETNSNHLLNLINDVLDLARIEAGRMELHLDAMDVPMLLDTVQSNNTGLFLNSPLTLTVEAEPDLPQIQADPIRMTQVLNNLISNAYKFTEAGAVTVHAYQENGEVCIAVEDTGIGIDENDLANVFERFRQVDGSFTRRAEGTGLGLSITQRLVEMHGGRIVVRSKPGEGSTFTVYLPAVEPA
ncbi:MAG: GAF domain-containing protein [Anaerolineae bacterium]|nr:GAF domain-containing protein [Anaerolineae bacterium]